VAQAIEHLPHKYKLSTNPSYHQKYRKKETNWNMVVETKPEGLRVLRTDGNVKKRGQTLEVK
jgi:hypothetical protein